MSLTVTIEAMLASGCSAEQMAAVVRAHEAQIEAKIAEKRAKDAARQRKSRMSRGVTVTPCDSCDIPSPPVSPSSPSPEPLPPSPPISPSSLGAERPKSSPKKVLRRTQIEEDAELLDAGKAIGRNAGMTNATIKWEWDRFKAHHIAKGSLMASWGQAWVTWVKNWKGFGSKQQPEPQNHGLNGRGRGVYKPGIGMVYPDGTVYSMLHNREP